MQQLRNEDEKNINDPEYIIKRSAAFQRVFRGADGEFVLRELSNVCLVNSILINYRTNPLVLAGNAGKRDVWLFIQNCLNADVEKAREVLSAETKKE